MKLSDQSGSIHHNINLQKGVGRLQIYQRGDWINKLGALIVVRGEMSDHWGFHVLK